MFIISLALARSEKKKKQQHHHHVAFPGLILTQIHLPSSRGRGNSTSRAVPDDARKQLRRREPLGIALVVHKHQTPLTVDAPLTGGIEKFSVEIILITNIESISDHENIAK